MVVAILLIIVILVQNPKGGGLSSEFGGSASQMFGVQKTGDILEQLTWGFFAFLIVGALATGIFMKGTSTSVISETDVERTKAAPVAPAQAPLTAPAQGTAPAQQTQPAATPAPATPAQ